MGGEASRESHQAMLDARYAQEKSNYESQMAIISQMDQKTKVPHLLIELRSLGFIEVCGKDTGGVYQRLQEFFTTNFRCQPVQNCFRDTASIECGCCVQSTPSLVQMEDWQRVSDLNFVCGIHMQNGGVQPNGVFQSRGQQGENNMGKLSCAVIQFMTHTCGWGLQLCDGGNNGMYGQYREQQIKFKAPHPLNLIAPIMMIELRQAGYIECNAPPEVLQSPIIQQLGAWLQQNWGCQQTQADPVYCDVKFNCPAFKKRGNEGENNMGMKTMEIVDFMTKTCAWTLLTCNGGNYGRKGDLREQQLCFRNDTHVQHGENHIMVEFRDRGYIEVNGLHDAQDAAQILDTLFKQSWRCTDYKAGMFESGEQFCDKKYTTPGGFFYRAGTTNNLGKLSVQLAMHMGQHGWKLTLCNGGNISDYHGYSIKREQQVKFTRALPGQKADDSILMIELRTVPTDQSGNYQGYIEVNGPDTNGIYQKLSDYLCQTMMCQAAGPQQFCDYLFHCNCFRLRDSSTNWQELKWNGKLNGESNFGRYTMRLCDFMVDHVGEWDLIVCNGNSIDTQFRINKDDTISVTGREQQLVFRFRPGGRAVFMAQQTNATVLGRPPKQPPNYWKEGSKQGTVAQEIVPATAEELSWIQQILDGTFKAKATRDRLAMGTGPLPQRYVAVSAVRSESPELWEKYAARRMEVNGRVKARTGAAATDFVEAKTKAACPGLCARCEDPRYGNPSNEQYLLHGSNPTSAMSILTTSFKVDFAGASAGTMFGPGVYLAEASSKADEYAKDENTGGAYDGLFAVLICRAVVGRSFVTQKPGDYRKEPTEGNFDSVLGDREKAVGTYREFIFFHEGAIYPEYAAFYRREYAPGEAPAPPPAAAAAPVPITMGAATPAKVQMQVAIPPGLGPGGQLQFQTPDGRTVQVVIPEGFTEGMNMTVEV